MSLLRPTVMRCGLGLRARHLHTSRALAIRATQARRDVVISPNETAGFKYIPGGPVIPGTVNDATTFPEASKSHGSYHWAFERILSAALIPITGAAWMASGTAYPIIDGIFAVSMIVHSHIGFDSCIQDYVHTRKFPVLGPLAKWALRAGTGLSVWGVYEFNTNDIGLTELVRRMWKA